jgi:hypothetical protein
MPDEGSTQSRTTWPLPKFHFQVQWDTHIMSFQEVSGLDIQAESIAYRHGDNATSPPSKCPASKSTPP